MKKLLFSISLLALILISCDNTFPTSDTDDNTKNNNPESIESLKQVDSLFQSLNAYPPNAWGIKTVMYSSQYTDENEWSKKKIYFISYSTGQGNQLECDETLNYSKKIFLEIPRIILNSVGLRIAEFSISRIDGTNNINFGQGCFFYEYNSYDKITKRSYAPYMTNGKQLISEYLYNEKRLIAHKNLSVTTFRYGDNGFINRMLNISTGTVPDTTFYVQNSKDHLVSLQLKSYWDGEPKESRYDYIYSLNTITCKHYSSKDNQIPCEINTSTFQDNQYQKLLSYESKSEDRIFKRIYEYSGNEITEISYINNEMIRKTEYSFNNEDRLVCKIKYDTNGNPLHRTIVEYYER